MIIVSDRKASDIKIFDMKGKLIKTLGRKGPGPGELNFPYCCAYQFPYLAVFDFGKRQIIIFKQTGISDFEYLKQILCVGLGSDIALSGESVIVSGYTRDKNAKEYGIYKINLQTLEKKEILPIERKYNLDSYTKYKNLYDKSFLTIGTGGYIALCKQFLYSIWEGDLVISRIGSDGIISFGEKTKNYSAPQATAEWKKAYKEMNGRQYDQECKNFSSIIGIFANDDFIGVLYGNYSNEFSRWEIYLQLYNSRDNQFLKELKLPGAVDESDSQPYHSFYFCKDKNVLYYISRELSEDQDIYKIHQYQIQK
ncbi:MAG: hypothetical protein JW725_05110 [Candidatus Babeliaceae bacterium]|nr:hypothetical protein [Candidatus Babeliaceae bacterium]